MQIQEWLSGSFDIKDVYGCIGTDLLLHLQIQEWLSGSFDIKDVYGCIGTDLLLQ